MTCCSESRKEAAGPSPPSNTGTTLPKLLQKTAIRLGTWNVRTMNEMGRCAQIAKEMNTYKLSVLGLAETRWNTFGECRLQTGETLLYSGKENEDDPHEAGVGLLLSAKANQSLLEWEPISERIIIARFNSNIQKTSIIMCYAPTNMASDKDKDNFYNHLQSMIDKVSKRDFLILMGDLNAKVGSTNNGREKKMGKHGLGSMNENGERFADFCAFNELVIGGTLFPHKNCHKATWLSPDHHTSNQIDHIAVGQRWRSSLQDVRVQRGADVASDHHLVICKMKIKLKSKRLEHSTRKKFNVRKLNNDETKKDFALSIQNKFASLPIEETEDESETVEPMWRRFKETVVDTCDAVLGKLPANRKTWITDETWQKVEKRKELKQKLNQARTRMRRQEAAREYKKMAKDVKKQLRDDKRAYINEIAEQAEQAAYKGDLKSLYATTKTLSGRKTNSNRPIRDKDGKLLTSIDQQLSRWKEHFEETLNRPTPTNTLSLEETEPIKMEIGQITNDEILKALKKYEKWKSSWVR